MELEDKVLANVVGGAISASLLNAISRGVSTLYDIGYAIGSTIRRMVTKNYC